MKIGSGGGGYRNIKVNGQERQKDSGNLEQQKEDGEGGGGEGGGGERKKVRQKERKNDRQTDRKKERKKKEKYSKEESRVKLLKFQGGRRTFFIRPESTAEEWTPKLSTFVKTPISTGRQKVNLLALCSCNRRRACVTSCASCTELREGQSQFVFQGWLATSLPSIFSEHIMIVFLERLSM